MRADTALKSILTLREELDVDCEPVSISWRKARSLYGTRANVHVSSSQASTRFRSLNGHEARDLHVLCSRSSVLS